MFVPPESKDTAKVLLEFELLTYAFNQNFPLEKMTIDKIWSILPNHTSVLPAPIKEEMLAVVRVFFKNVFSKDSFKELSKQYMSVDTHYRLYQIDQQGNVTRQNPTYFQHRETKYQTFLCKKSIEHVVKPLPLFLTKEDAYIYFNVKKDKFSKELERNYIQTPNGKIPNHLFKQVSTHDVGCLTYGNKKIPKEQLTLLLEGNPWKETAKRMNAKQKKNVTGRDWEKASESFRLLDHAGDQATSFAYKEQVGLAGLVGAGKTTFTLLEIARLTALGAKVGLVTMNTPATLDFVYRLYLLGIKAAPIIGKSNLDGHLKNFIKKVENESKYGDNAEPLSQLAVEYVLRFFGGKCLIKTLTKSDNETRLPCESMYSSNKKNKKNNKDKKACPFYAQCGIYQAENDMKDAQVWVGTSDAVLQSKAPFYFDLKERRYYELMYEHMDVIFVDEADGVQESFDNALIQHKPLFGQVGSLLELLFLKGNQELIFKHELANDAIVNKWKKSLNKAEETKTIIYGLIENSLQLRKFLNKQTFGTKQIALQIGKKVLGVSDIESVKQHAFFTLLDTCLKRDETTQYLAEIEAIRTNIELDVIERMSKQKEKSYALLADYLTEANAMRVFSEEEKMEIVDLFEFYIFFSIFDEHFKYISFNKSYIESAASTDFDIDDARLKYADTYKPFIPEPLTGRYFQYRYEQKKDDEFGKFSVYEYVGVGRDLLTEWGSLFEHASEADQPSIVFLSGTSYAPGSAHYHVNIPTDYLLESTKPKKSTLEQFFTPVMKDGKPLAISGVQHDKQREENLAYMAYQLKEQIDLELAHWQHVGRKVLLIVNSYDQCKIVLNTLKPFYPNKVKALTNNTGLGNDYILRSEVEYFAQTEADILIVPLLSINRGYNILKDTISGESLFGSAFFMVRPYIVPGSISNAIQNLHGVLPNYIQTIHQDHLMFHEGVNYIRKQANVLFEKLLVDTDFWADLDENERTILSWYTFVNVWQMIGRLLRGDTDARIFYTDAKFAPQTAVSAPTKESVQTSMLKAWEQMLLQDQTIVNQKLYEIFIQSIGNVFN